MAVEREEKNGFCPHWGPWVDNLWVAPGHRGRGLGTALLGAAVSACRDWGFPAVYLCTEGYMHLCTYVCAYVLMYVPMYVPIIVTYVYLNLFIHACMHVCM